MSEPKTKQNSNSFVDFLNTVEPEQKRRDSVKINLQYSK